MRKVIIESPYAGRTHINIPYAKECMKDSLRRGEAPIASHLLYTQKGILDDTIPEERELGIKAGLAWAEKADAQIFYVDLGWSEGMKQAEKHAYDNKTKVEIRRILTPERAKELRQIG